MDLYRIKPLEWDEHNYARTPFGSYDIIHRDMSSVENYGYNEWEVHYCFDEYYDEDCLACESLEDGKAVAQKHWEERLTEALEPAQEVAG